MHSSLTCGEWSTIGCLNHHTRLFVGDMVTVTFYDAQGELVDLSFDYKITSSEQGEPQSWPRYIAEHINMYIPLVEAGKMTEHGLVVAYRSNQIYALKGSGIINAELTFHCIAQCDNEKKDEPAYDYVYPNKSCDYNAGVKVLQPKTGLIYRCKPWPFDQFCKVKEESNPLYEPGVGQSWGLAWQQVSCN
ncbi:MAG: chitin-binding protein [Pseudoalteromonas sp.]|uniref:chitin-binding protein n=1 Tax=unclassified Pseudoalteromonas TaxID=194690 RepID=UPI000C070765|nr:MULTISPECIES: chitin-binding protein [unclassified Pseudoalteromonas]MDP2633535.1 chitin-binding protein [Pseudoalteromonas sp. 1_MG-2023]PHN90446.1 chitin-binding protein [Pseudoalteromonas sp. 3D05]TGE83788.1 chitin-binding protein [Pseudoalteromonas sp. KS88]